MSFHAPRRPKFLSSSQLLEVFFDLFASWSAEFVPYFALGVFLFVHCQTVRVLADGKARRAKCNLGLVDVSGMIQ